MKTKIKSIIQSLQHIIIEEGLEINDNLIFDKAIDIYIFGNTEEKEDKELFNKEIPATDKQKDLIKKLNKGKVPAGITKQEAIVMIKELKEKQNYY